MELTNQNIQDLYKFTRKHYVEHYDVQTELVDHLANDIEGICKENPMLSFEQARDKSFKKFGVFGFMNVVDSKQRQMQKKYVKTIFSFVREWFRLPKIIMTLLLIAIFYQITKTPIAYYVYTAMYFIIIFVELFFVFFSNKKLKRKEKETNKKWLFEDMILKQGIGSLALIMFYVFDFSTPDNGNFELMNDLQRVLSASIMVLTIIVAYVTMYVIPQKTEELLETHYPEYKLV